MIIEGDGVRSRKYKYIEFVFTNPACCPGKKQHIFHAVMDIFKNDNQQWEMDAHAEVGGMTWDF
jgi:hypothetical protein